MSSSSSEDRLISWNTEEARKYIVHDIFLAFYFFAGIIGNAVVLLVYQFKLKKKSESRYFFPYLAFFDFFACGLRAPFELWVALLPVNFQDILGCQIVWWLVNFFTFTSIYLLAVITFQRYLKVCRPFGFQLSLRLRRVCLIIVVLMGIAFASPFIIWNEILEIKNPDRNVTGYICRADVSKLDASSNSFLVFIFFLSLIFVLVMVVLIVFNILILRKINVILKRNAGKNNAIDKHQFQMQSTETDKPSSDNPQSTSGLSKMADSCEEISPKQPNGKSENQTFGRSIKRFSYMITIISVAFILSCIPQISLLFAFSQNRYFWTEATETELIVFRFMDHMMIINNVVNPYVYGYFDLKFRHSAKELLCCCCLGRK